MNTNIQQRALIQEFFNRQGQLRYRIIDKFTGELIYDAQGCGFKSEEKALSFLTGKKVAPKNCSAEPLF